MSSPCSPSQGGKKLGSELHRGKTKAFLQLAAHFIHRSSTDFRCWRWGKPSVALQAMELSCTQSGFWLFCFQLEKPLRKQISEHFLQNYIYPSHLLFSGDGELPGMPQKMKKGLPGFPREVWSFVFSR